MGAGQAPLPVLILEAAEAWGIPPWQVEAECSRKWWMWYTIKRNAQAKELTRRLKDKAK